MNIFILDTDPMLAAQAHCDVHVVKMILETTQLLCTARSAAGRPVANGYKPTHTGHPCTKWVQQSAQNYKWLCRLLFWLHHEYTHRYSRVHASRRLFNALCTEDTGLPRREQTPFVYVGVEECRVEDVVESYRRLYRHKQQTMKREMRWTKRTSPGWVSP